MVLATIGLLGAAVFVLYLYALFKYRWANKIPGVEPTVPVFGNGLQFAQQNSFKIFQNMVDLFQHDKRIFKLRFGPISVVCPNHPDLLQKVLTDTATLSKPFVYKFLRLDHGLTAGKYETWRVHRRALNPTFNTRILNSFIPVFTECVDAMVRKIKEQHVEGKPVDALAFTSPCTLGMICRTSLGSKCLEQEGTQQFIDGLERIFHNLGLRMFNANLYPEFVYRCTRFYRDEMKAREFCNAFTDKIIHERQNEFAKQKMQAVDENNNVCETKVEEEDDMVTFKKPQIFVDQLLTIPLPGGTPFSHEEVRDHIYTIIAGGNDTSATQAAHTILLLAMHPEVQDKVAAELREVYPTPETKFCPEVMKKLTYMELVIKESLRLCPAAPVIARQNMADLQLDQYVIPKGNIFILNIFNLQRRKDFWGEDADLFVPERFLPENSKNRHPFAYLPFSGGPRDCLGRRYAMISLKLQLSQILREFKLTTDIKYEDLRFKFKVMMHLAFEHRVFLEPRNLYG